MCTSFSYQKEDVDHDRQLNFYVECPCCHNKIFDIDQSEFNDEVTVNNLSFPTSFFQFGGKNTYHVTDDEITKWCKECVEQLERCNEDYGVFAFKATGNTEVIVMKFEDEYSITVAKNYYTASISR